MALTKSSKSVAASGSGSDIKESRPSKRRGQNKVSLACSTCRRRKIKCDGGRPSCSTCSKRENECSYDHEHDERPLPALKRKFEALESQNADARELLEAMRTAPYEDAVRLLVQLRSQDAPPDVQTPLSMEGTATPMTPQMTQPLHSLSEGEAQQTIGSVDTTAESDDSTTMYPNPDFVTAGPSWSHPMDPYVC